MLPPMLLLCLSYAPPRLLLCPSLCPPALPYECGRDAHNSDAENPARPFARCLAGAPFLTHGRGVGQARLAPALAAPPKAGTVVVLACEVARIPSGRCARCPSQGGETPPRATARGADARRLWLYRPRTRAWGSLGPEHALGSGHDGPEHHRGLHPDLSARVEQYAPLACRTGTGGPRGAHGVGRCRPRPPDARPRSTGFIF